MLRAVKFLPPVLLRKAKKATWTPGVNSSEVPSMVKMAEVSDSCASALAASAQIQPFGKLRPKFVSR